MMEDTIIKELRLKRREIEDNCGNDPQKFYEHILKEQEKYKDKLVRRQPKPALKLAV